MKLIGLITLLLATFGVHAASSQAVIVDLGGPLIVINETGLSLILLGIIFMLFEIMAPTIGVIGIAGVIAFIAGSVMIINLHGSYNQSDVFLLALVALLWIAFFVLVMVLALQAYKRKIVSGREALIGSEAIVLSVNDHNITVRVMGEIWDATVTSPVSVGDKVIVMKVNGLVLNVRR